MSAFDVTQPEIHTRPLGAPAAWLPVVAAADHQCECKGACGRTHSRTEFRCDRRHDSNGVRLLVAPADLSLSPVAAAELPADELRAWCPECHRLALRRHRDRAEAFTRLEAPRPATLFDL